MDDAHAPGVINGQLNNVNLFECQIPNIGSPKGSKNDKMTNNLKRWIDIRAPDRQSDFEKDSYIILIQFYAQRKDLLYLKKTR